MPQKNRSGNEWIVEDNAEKTGPYTADQIRQMFEKGEIKGSAYIKSDLDPDVHMRVLDLLRVRSETAFSLFEALQSVKDHPGKDLKPVNKPAPIASSTPVSSPPPSLQPITQPPKGFHPLVISGSVFFSVLALWAGVELIKSLRPSSMTQYFCVNPPTPQQAFTSPIQSVPAVPVASTNSSPASNTLSGTPTNTLPQPPSSPSSAFSSQNTSVSTRTSSRDRDKDRGDRDRDRDRDRESTRDRGDRDRDRDRDRESMRDRGDRDPPPDRFGNADEEALTSPGPSSIDHMDDLKQNADNKY